MRAILAVGLLVLAALGAGCASASCPSDATSAIKIIDVRVGSGAGGTMYQTPTEVKVAHCDRVRLVVHNEDTIFHDVALLDYDGHDIEHEVPAGQTVSTRSAGNDFFTATVTGTFVLKCEVKGHAEKGMAGTFVVA